MKKYSDFEVYLFYMAVQTTQRTIELHFPLMKFDESGTVREISREMVFSTMFDKKRRKNDT